MAEDASFASLMETAGARGTALRLRAGDVVTATVIQIDDAFVFLDVGMPSDGRIARAELADRDGSLRIRVGDSVRATVVDPRPDGPVLAVAFGHGDKLDTSSLELALSSGTPVEGEVGRVVKGGVEVSVGGIRAFCPASLLELGHVADLSVFVGQKLEFRILEVRDNGRSVVLSRRALLEERRREAAAGARERLVPGTDVDGVVQSLGKHGAVVELDGVEGFIHLSELAAHRVERAEDALRVGEQVRARVLSVEDSPKGLRVRLSLRALSAQAEAATPPPADEILTATVTRAAQNGVFVQTPRGEGLVPMRELGLPPGADHRRAYPAGKQFPVVVISRAGGRLAFSATQVARVEERQNFREFSGAASAPAATSFGSLGDMLRGKLGGAAIPAAPSAAVEPAPTPSAPASSAPAPSAHAPSRAAEPLAAAKSSQASSSGKSGGSAGTPKADNAGPRQDVIRRRR